jgi:thiamine pyrophosphate-dependent acetolactate synthase large subunit-like protein
MGLGGYPATDKQFVGMLGMHGTFEANMAMHYCDVMLAVGARFDDRVIGNPGTFWSKKSAQDHHISTSTLRRFPSGSRSMCRSSATCRRAG